jgi:putative ABC transport system permease protein
MEGSLSMIEVLTTTEVITLVLTIVLVVITAACARRFNIGKEISLAGLRAIIQILVLASVISMLFQMSFGWSLLILLAMAVIAGHTTYTRSGKLTKGLTPAIASIVIAAIVVLIPFFLLGIFPIEARYLIPIGSIFIGNAMNISSLAIDRYMGEIKNRKSEIEAYLALGAPPKLATAACLNQGINAALIPSINNLKNLGLVWIPGVMTGLLLGGADPIEVALFRSLCSFQF